MQTVYILSASIVSPQQHFEDEGFLDNIKTTDDGSFYVSEPNYRKYINPVAIRRMSKMLKMGISTGMNALEQAGIEQPNAIITGTGRGSMVDMEQFLLSMIETQEGALTPTTFIQSTYNSINGWLALQTKSNGYNQTYVNRGISLALAMLDAQMMLNEDTNHKNILVGCFDEITPDYVRVKGKINYWKKPTVNSADLYKSNTTGTIAGEGAAFFTLSNQKDNALCSLLGIRTLQDGTTEEVDTGIEQLLGEHNLSIEEIDIVLCGMNGDNSQMDIYNHLIDNKSDNTTIAVFKHLCGEYDTSSGFATWIATKLFKEQKIPETLVYKKGSHKNIKNILLVNHYILNSTSIMLLQKV